ncbi:MAG: IPT/TIG domain-containing protein, partial [Candidatus Kerfeldbacteria bacterium]|nr:IPT/TIG domain-containing protein [Candidatus Kerfeldbacteria bacterium]
ISFNGQTPASIGTWTSTSIPTVDVPDAGTDSGTITITRASDSKASNASGTFYIYPQITATVAVGTDAAREYDAGDTDGVITVSGNHFGAAGTVTILGSTGTQQTTGSCSGTAYQATCVGLQVPTAIADSTYTGSIVLTRTSDTKASTYAGFRILPRITSLTPDSGSNGTSATIAGDHLCQSGACLTAAQWNATPDDGDDVKWGTTNATVTGTPSHTSIIANAPALANGPYTVTVTSSTYVSNGKTFTIVNVALTVSTAGSQVATVVSGATSQHIGGGSTAAFRLQIDVGSALVSTVKVSDTGNVTFANLTSPKLYYENGAACAYDGIESNVTGSYTGEGASFTLPSVSIAVAPNYTCLYFVSDVGSSASGGQTIDVEITNPSTDVSVSGATNSDTVAKAITGTTTVLPNATSITNDTEGALTDGGRSTQSITILGAGFGSASAGSRASCAGAVNTGCIKVGGTSGYTVVDGDVITWSATSITFTVNAAISNDGGTGASGLVFYGGAQVDGTPVTFYVYPRVSSVDVTASTSGTPIANGVTEARQTDTIRINGDHLGTGGTTTNLSVNGTNVSGTLVWSSTQVTSAIIAGGTVTGNVVATRPSDSRTSGTFAFAILPRITSITVPADAPADSAWQGSSLTITGDHFEASQGSGKVTINGSDVTSGMTWGDTSVSGVAVPSGATNNGSITLTRNTGGKVSNTYATFYVLPKVTSTGPTNGEGGEGDTVSLTGNHFGTVAGTVRFYNASQTVDVTSGLTWGASSITGVVIPAGVNDNLDSFNLEVVRSAAGGQSDGKSSTNDVRDNSAYKLLPKITRVDVTASGSGTTIANSVTEAKQSDTLRIYGNHFGAAATGSVTVNGAATSGARTQSCAASGTPDGCSIITVVIGNGTSSPLEQGTAAGNIVVTRAADAKTNTTAFTLLPRITSLITAEVADAFREGDASVTVNGDHFGTTADIVPITLTAQAAVNATVNTWTSGTDISLDIPAALVDTVDNGTLGVRRLSDSKTANNWSITVLPKITGLNPIEGAEADQITISGNHFGSDPGAGNRSSTTDNVKFGATQALNADFVNPEWSATTINVKVPVGVPTGAQNIVVRRLSRDSNAQPFTVQAPEPVAPTNLYQFTANTDTAQPPTTNMAVGDGVGGQLVIWFRLDMTGGKKNENYYPQVEVKPLGTAFECTGSGACSVTSGYYNEGSGVNYPGGAAVKGWASVTAADAGQYHWQARVRNSAGNGPWASFGGNADPNDLDVYVDNSAPGITLNGGNCSGATSNLSDRGATITWSTSDATSGAEPPPGSGAYSTGQVEYLASSQFTDWTSTPGTTTTLQPRENSPHIVIISGLNPSTSYSFRVRSKDGVSNEGYSHTGASACTFNTTSSRPMKSIQHFIGQETAATTAGTLITYSPSIYIPESPASDIVIKSAIIEVNGVSASGSQALKVELKRGTGAYGSDGGAASYTVDATDAITPFKILFDALNPPASCTDCQNMNDITTGANTYNYKFYLKPTVAGVSALSAKLILTYTYVP